MNNNPVKLIEVYRSDLIETLEFKYKGCYFDTTVEIHTLEFIVPNKTMYIPFSIHHYKYRFKLRFLNQW